MGMTMGQASKALVELPMKRWLVIGRRYDVTASEVISDFEAHQDVALILCANEAQRAASVEKGETPRDQFEQFEDMSWLELVQVFDDADELDEGQMPELPAETEVEVPDEPGSFPAAEGPQPGDGGAVVAAAEGPVLSGPVDQPADVRPAHAV